MTPSNFTPKGRSTVYRHSVNNVFSTSYTLLIFGMFKMQSCKIHLLAVPAKPEGKRPLGRPRTQT